MFKRKDGTWQGAVTLGFDEDGTQKRRTIYGKTQREVLEKLEAIKRRLANGYAETAHTVASYLKEWLDDKRLEVKPQTVEDYLYQLEKYVIPRVGKVKLSSLTPRHVQTMCTELATEISPQRANKCRRVLSGALSQAVRLERIGRNPCDAVKPKKVEVREMVLWSPEHLALFLDTSRSHRLHALFYLAVSTGMRRGELLGLRWCDVEAGSLVVRQSLIDQRGKIMLTTPKTVRSYRRVMLSPDASEILSAHCVRQESERRELGAAWPDTGLVFVSEVGTAIHPRNLERTWLSLQRAAREKKRVVLKETLRASLHAEALEQALAAVQDLALLPHARLHDLRHLHASLAISGGMQVKVLANRLGHAKPSFTLDVYTHLFEEQLQNSAVSIVPFVTKHVRGIN